MSFARSKKIFHQENKYLPPPGYYEISQQKSKSKVFNFDRGQRFIQKVQNLNPGPGAYHNTDKQSIKKRLIQQVNKRQSFKSFGSMSKQHDQMKAILIPSIPNKSVTRVYEQLAPGVLILHQQQYQNKDIGPGSYDVNQSLVKKKVNGATIQPLHKKRMPIIDQQSQIKVPTMAQQLRQQKRLLYKQNLYKSSNVNKNDINSSDLCLETIILRQRLLRGDQIPPPGYYYNEDLYSTFKKNDFQKPPELQALGGKEQRFRDNDMLNNIGPGAYSIKEEIVKKGGIIGKMAKDDTSILKKMFDPGPGAYELKSLKVLKQQPKGNYPPIFGSGCKRFTSAPKPILQTPGPGSYKIDKKNKKKAKYIKIRKDFYESQPITKPQIDNSNPMVFVNKSIAQDSNKQQLYYSANQKSRKQKNAHYFKSKVDRFLNNKSQFVTGPGVYDINQSGFTKGTYNRTNQGYVGDKSQRFDDVKIRPNIGPGTYY